MGDQEEEFEKTLFNIQLLQSQFLRHISDLKALKHSTKDAVAQLQATDGDYEKLKDELENLASFQKEYEACVNLFNGQFGWKQQETADALNKSLDKNLTDARNLKVNVEMLMRRVKKQLVLGEEETDGFDAPDDEKEGVVDKGEANKQGEQHESHGESENEAASDIEQEFDGEEENKSCRNMSLLIGGCISVVIIFYMALGAVIKIVNENKPEINEGETLV